MVVKSHKTDVNIGALRSSPIHGIKPISAQPIQLDVDAVVSDETNPGAVTESLRYSRREPSIRDSFDIIGSVVYPIVVCEHTNDVKRENGKHINIDGHGRLDQIRRRNEPTVWALVYPPLNLEQRICLRQTLGASQEPFDAVSVMQDLQILAKERGLDVSNVDDLEVLLRDLPEKVRKYRRDLLILTRWDLDSLDSPARLGESYKQNSHAIGLDKIRAMTRIVDALKDHHPKVYQELGGDKGTTRRLASMYVAKKFSTGRRSQDALRTVVKAIRELDEGNPLVETFFNEELDHAVLVPFAPKKGPTPNDIPTPKDIRTLCQDLASLLVVADPDDLDDAERTAIGNLNALVTGFF